MVSVGSILEGKVVSVMPSGALVDIGINSPVLFTYPNFLQDMLRI